VHGSAELRALTSEKTGAVGLKADSGKAAWNGVGLDSEGWDGYSVDDVDSGQQEDGNRGDGDKVGNGEGHEVTEHKRILEGNVRSVSDPVPLEADQVHDLSTGSVGYENYKLVDGQNTGTRDDQSEKLDLTRGRVGGSASGRASSNLGSGEEQAGHSKKQTDENTSKSSTGSKNGN